MAQRRKLADDILAGDAEVNLTELSDAALMDLVRLDVTRVALQRRRAGAAGAGSPRPSAQASFRRVPTHLDTPRPRRPICYSRRMSVPPAVSPFVPGRGGLPPYLAGPDNEQHALLTGQALKSAIAAALPGGSNADALQCQEELAGVGYVWRSPGAGNLWEPGIPSLMRYIETTERHGGAAP